MGLKEGEEGSEGAPASEADGRSPREPGMTLASSERLGVQHDERLFIPDMQSCSHVPEQILRQDHAVELSWVGD